MTMKIKKIFQLLFVPASFFNLSRIGKILIIEYLLAIHFFGIIFFSSILYQDISSYPGSMSPVFIAPFYLIVLSSFFYLNTSFIEWILQIVFSRTSALKQFCRILNGLFILLLCFVGLMIAVEISEPPMVCGCVSTTLEQSTAPTADPVH
jgi:hypothetical protein